MPNILNFQEKKQPCISEKAEQRGGGGAGEGREAEDLGQGQGHRVQDQLPGQGDPFPELVKVDQAWLVEAE